MKLKLLSVLCVNFQSVKKTVHSLRQPAWYCRNTKVRRELCAMFSINCEDLSTPLPTKKLFRSLSMKEASRRNRERLIRNSFLLELNGRKEGGKPGKPHSAVPVEGQTLLLSLNSSQESSARSSFSSVGQTTGQTSGQKQQRFVLVHADSERMEATC